MKHKKLLLFCMVLLILTVTTSCHSTTNFSSNTYIPKGAAQKVSVTKKPQLSKSYYGKLHVSGSYLKNKHNKPVQLKGLSTHGLSWFPQYVNKKTWKELRDKWNINVMRLAMYTEEYNGYCVSNYTQKKKLKALIHKGIKIARELDLYVIVDWHILSDSNPLSHVKEAKKFFKEISSKYKNDPHILYEICNEPNGNTSWKDIKKYAKQVIPVIRKQSPHSIIIVGTPTWSQDVDIASKSPLKKYKNIMYALHFYADTHRNDLRKKMVGAIKNGLPVFVSEYGICDASGNGSINAKEANKWVALMNQYKVSYVAWNLSNKSESSAILKSNCHKTSGFSTKNLSASGRWLKKMLGGTNINNKTPSTPPSKNYKHIIKNITIGKSVKPSITLKNSWNEGNKKCYLFAISLKNTSSSNIKNWRFKLHFKKNIELLNWWNCNVRANKKILSISPASYNKTIKRKSSIFDLGIIVKIPSS